MLIVDAWAKGKENKRISLDEKGKMGQLSAHLNDMMENLIENKVMLKESKREADKAKNEAELANNVKTHFTNQVAYKLQGPIQMMIKYAESALKNNSLPEGKKNRLNIILGSAMQQAALVNKVIERFIT